jgi:hypothetical protein
LLCSPVSAVVNGSGSLFPTLSPTEKVALPSSELQTLPITFARTTSRLDPLSRYYVKVSNSVFYQRKRSTT